jgi:hypothetical protein
MRRVCFCLLLSVIFASNLAAQNPAAPPKPVAKESWGSVENGKFVSKKLRLSLPIPSDLTVISTAEAEILTDAGVDMVKQGTASEARIDEAFKRSIILLGIAESPVGSPQNSFLELVAVKQVKGVTARMSLAANLMVLKGSPYTLKRSLGEVKIGPNTYAAAELDVSFNEVNFMQRMYVVMHGEYAVVCAITYFSDAQRLKMEKVLSMLELTK